MTKTVQIPTINDSPNDFEQLFSIWKQVNDHVDVRFDFSGCRFLRPNAVAFLGGLARLIESRVCSAIFDWDTLTNSWVKINLCQNGFAGTFGYPSPAWTGNSIPYREDLTMAPDDYAEYLSEYWLGRGWVHVSELLKNAIVERMLEIYMNAFEHSGTPIGVFTCGQYFRPLIRLILSIIYFGLVIPANVRGYLKEIRPDLPAETLSAEGCLKWAFQRGSTTRPNGTGRGIGLDLLKSFIKCNGGRLEVFSNEGYALITAQEEQFLSMPYSFEGTLFHVSLICDETYYCLAGEAREYK